MKLLQLILFVGISLQFCAALSIHSGASIVANHDDHDDHEDRERERKDAELLRQTDDLIGRAAIILKYLPDGDFKREIQIIEQNLKFLKYMFLDPEDKKEKDHLRHDLEETNKELEPVLAEAEKWIRKLPTTPAPSSTSQTETPTTEMPIEEKDQKLIQKVHQLMQDGHHELIEFRSNENYFSEALRFELLQLDKSLQYFQLELRNPYNLTMLYDVFVPMARQKLEQNVQQLTAIIEMGRLYGTEPTYDNFLKLFDPIITRSYAFLGYLYLNEKDKCADELKREVNKIKELQDGLKKIDRHLSPELAADGVAKILQHQQILIEQMFRLDEEVHFDLTAFKSKISIDYDFEE